MIQSLNHQSPTAHHYTASSRNSSTSTTARPAELPLELQPLDLMDLQGLFQRMIAESARFYRGQPYDTRFSYELFRRAIVLHNGDAWTMLYTHYYPLVDGWVKRSSAFASTGESSEYFVNRAFEKFWIALTPERFMRFPDLASLLRYLQLCTNSVIVDTVRVRAWSNIVAEEEAQNSGQPLTARDDDADERIDRQEFWQVIGALLQTPQERVIVQEAFLQGMTPRVIFDRHTALFGNINEVYNVKRNLLGRLSRSKTLRQFIEA